MLSDLECPICYCAYDAGRRCPRQLRCHHSFCESCLSALSRPRERADGSIVCPLCRHATPIPGVGKVRVALRVDELVLERLLAAGVRVKKEQEEGEEAGNEEPAPGESFTGSGSGRLRQSWRNAWRRISGRSSRRGRGDCITSADMRNLVLMSCHMF